MADGLKLKYFVLNPSSSDEAHKEARRAAIITYAEEIALTQPNTAFDLLKWINAIDLELEP